MNDHVISKFNKKLSFEECEVFFSLFFQFQTEKSYGEQYLKTGDGSYLTGASN